MEEKAVLGWLWYGAVLDWDDELDDRRVGDSSEATELAMGVCWIRHRSGVLYC